MVEWESSSLYFRGPQLKTMRLDSTILFFKPHLLIKILEKRLEKVEEGFEVDGIKMVQLEKLVISKKHLGKKVISQLEELVEEVVDTKDAPDYWEFKI